MSSRHCSSQYSSHRRRARRSARVTAARSARARPPRRAQARPPGARPVCRRGRSAIRSCNLLSLWIIHLSEKWEGEWHKALVYAGREELEEPGAGGRALQPLHQAEVAREGRGPRFVEVAAAQALPTNPALQPTNPPAQPTNPALDVSWPRVPRAGPPAGHAGRRPSAGRHRRAAGARGGRGRQRARPAAGGARGSPCTCRGQGSIFLRLIVYALSSRHTTFHTTIIQSKIVRKRKTHRRRQLSGWAATSTVT